MRKEKEPEKRCIGSSAGRECATTTTTRKSKESKFEEEGSLMGEFLDFVFFVIISMLIFQSRGGSKVLCMLGKCVTPDPHPISLCFCFHMMMVFSGYEVN